MRRHPSVGSGCQRVEEYEWRVLAWTTSLVTFESTLRDDGQTMIKTNMKGHE